MTLSFYYLHKAHYRGLESPLFFRPVSPDHPELPFLTAEGQGEELIFMKTLIQIQDLRKTYGERVLLGGATAAFGERQKIGVIGRNGAGKSTLFRILTGTEESDSGEITKSRDLKLAYLEQNDPFRDNESVMDFLLRYTEKPVWECGRMAGRFLIKGAMLEAPIRSLAGGFQMRVKLAAMLLAEPNFLLLDEPTNYLDLNTLLLLERMLQSWNGGFLVISHDREFLKRTCDHTLEVENGGLFMFPGPVEEYLIYKEEEQEKTQKRMKNQEAKEKAIQDFIDRFRAKASKASQAQSRVKLLEKMEKIEIAGPPPKVKIRIPQVQAKKSIALELRDLQIGYPEKTIASGIQLQIDRGERLAVLGDNGQGKTTLLKTLAGEIQSQHGELKWGAGIRTGYYAQHVYTSLDSSDTVEQALEKAAAPGTKKQEILDMAGAFLFQGDDAKKIISVLSGGERARLSLAGILLSGCDVLLLDEPTNHLDFDTVEALGRALQSFAGTVIFVSHDRTFVNLSASRIIELKDGQAEFFPGSYEEYVFHLEQRIQEQDMDENQSSENTNTNRDEQKPNRHQRRKEIRSELGKIEKEIVRLEQKVGTLTARRDQLLEKIQNQNDSDLYNLTKELEETTNLMETEEGIWLEIEEKKESLMQELSDLQ